MAEIGTRELRKYLEDNAAIEPVVDWLRRHGVDPIDVVRGPLSKLLDKGRFLAGPERAKYAGKVLTNEFLVRWHLKHRDRAGIPFSPQELQEELRPFELALMAIGHEKAFLRTTSRMARHSMLKHLNVTVGTGDDFAAFVAKRTTLLARKFIDNFNSARPDAALRVGSYLLTTAVSQYLVRRTRPIRTDAPGLHEYLRQARRLSPRSVLAIKLAYLPSSLTPAETMVLKRQYGLAGPFGRRIPIKDIATALGYRNPAALSRKLYRVRAWCRAFSERERRRILEGAVAEVRYA